MLAKHAPYNVVLGIVLGLLLTVFFAFTLGRMSVNALLFLSVVALAGLMLLGIFVSLHPNRPWVMERRTLLSMFFATLGLTGTVVASIQGVRANRETSGIQEELTTVRQRLSERETDYARLRSESSQIREEVQRAQNLNRDLQQKLLDQSTQLKDLAIQRVSEVTGGDAFAYLDLGAASASGVALQARVNGTYPLRQVRYRIGENAALVHVGDLAARSVRPLETVLSSGRYQITILAANGPVHEELELRFNAAGQRWERRVKVLRDGEVVLDRPWGR